MTRVHATSQVYKPSDKNIKDVITISTNGFSNYHMQDDK